MPPLKYDYDLDRGDGPGGSRARAIIIFIIALGVIGCGIYFFILPHADGDSKNGTVAAPTGKYRPGTTPAESADNSLKTIGKSVPGTDAPPAPGSPGNDVAGGAETAASGQQPEQPAAEDAGKTGDDVPQKPTDLTGGDDKPAAPQPSSGIPTEDPQKGKPWVGDPLSEQPSTGNTGADANAAATAPRPTDPADSAIIVTVRAGDSLSRLAHRHHTTVEALRHYNKLRKDVIRIDQKLRVIPGPWRITVDKNRRELTLERLADGKWGNFVKFSVGLGRLNSTPDAQFVISTRLRHPDWYTADGRIYRYGDPENQLGDYFLKLAMTGSPDKPLLGYGIHGTPDEGSVGKNWSNGCIRMRNRDVEILYYLVPSGTPVKIVPGTDAPPPNGDMRP